MKNTILVADDDPLMHVLVDEAIGGTYRTIAASDGATCLATAREQAPDLILLDVEMPGIDGYETCRRIKAEAWLAATPVIFISAHDQIEARLRGYEAGADDYIVKPLDPRELLAKIAGLLEHVKEKTQLKAMVSHASQTAMTAMSSMSEIGALLQVLQSFNSCTDYAALAKATLKGIDDYGLSGAVQVRAPQGPLTLASSGGASPLEASVIGHMAGMERIVQYRNRLSVTYPHVSILINNMPSEDEERAGRLRDHLAILVESAEVRVKTLIAEEQTNLRNQRIAASVAYITTTLGEIDRDLRETRIATGIAVQELITRMERAYISMALAESQEEMLARICNDSVSEVLEAQMMENAQQDKMSAIVSELKKIQACE